MIKLKDLLLLELEKNKWQDLSSKDLVKHKAELVKLVKNSYKKIGGHPAVKSTSDIPGKIEIWQGIDVDANPDVDATLGFKRKSSGNKMVVMGQDGSSAAKKAVVKRFLSLLKQKGWYAEVSVDIIEKFNLQPIDDESKIVKILKGKSIDWLGSGYYTRSIGGTDHKKAMVGNPK